MVIELYGSPGAGKTYIKEQLIEEEGCQGSPNKENPLIRIAKRLVIYLPSSRKIRKKIIKKIENVNEPAYNNVTLESCVDNIVMVLFGYRHTRRKLFMDEGVVHRLISMSVNFRIGFDCLSEILDSLSPWLEDVTVFYLFAEPEECYQSIKKRNRHICNIDELEDGELRNYLRDYKLYCDYVYKKMGYQRISRNNIEKVRKRMND